jgi:hypothetical protein
MTITRTPSGWVLTWPDGKQTTHATFDEAQAIVEQVTLAIGSVESSYGSTQ